jgi:tellurite resistance protein
MVEPGVLPHLAVAVEDIQREVPSIGAIECFVYHEPDVNAFVTRGRTKTLVAISSGAVNYLDTQELKFVLGHEIGHALCEHVEVSAAHLVEQGGAMPASMMRLHDWNRAAEISADRAGLLLCGSLDAAARALFKAASGIVNPNVIVSPTHFAAQWHQLLEEVVDDGERDLWQVSHPFPALRMEAMVSFWGAWQGAGPTAAALESVNASVARMLALMNPLAASRTLEDPLLMAFFLWGGLYIAVCDGVLHSSERARLESVAPANLDFRTVAERALADPKTCLDAFAEAKRARRTKLTALELHRIIYGLIDVAAADGEVSPEELKHLNELGAVLGISPQACELIVRKYDQEVRRANQG